MILGFFVSTDMDIKHCLGGHQNHHKFLSAFFFFKSQSQLWSDFYLTLSLSLSGSHHFQNHKDEEKGNNHNFLTSVSTFCA